MDENLIKGFMRIFTDPQEKLIPEVREAVRRLVECENQDLPGDRVSDSRGDRFNDPLGR